jgi:hypothetical protein
MFITTAVVVSSSFRKMLATERHANMEMDWIEWMFIRGEKGRKCIEIIYTFFFKSGVTEMDFGIIDS